MDVEYAALNSSIPLNLESTQKLFVPKHGIAATRRSGPHLLDRATLLSTFDIRMIGVENSRPGLPADDVVRGDRIQRSS